MKSNTKSWLRLSLLIMLPIFVSCNNNSSELVKTELPASIPISDTASTDTTQIPAASNKTQYTLRSYDDIRHFSWNVDSTGIYEESSYNKDAIYTFTFNEGTVLKGSEDIQSQIMENGKNPGLGIRKLHNEGITGKGVNVAIIDQNLLLNHPEFDGKIVAYYDTGCDQPSDSGSMHAPAVTSILVGDTIGVAPDASVYFAAAPSWTGDSEFYAKALHWIIDENEKLSDDSKIRVVSVSAAPSGTGSPFTKNLEMWDKAVLAAQEAGILVLDCRNNDKTGIIAPAFYDPANADDVTMCTGGFPTSRYKVLPTHIGVPTSYRTVAEEYTEGLPSYQYTGQGGLSWGIPYAAGVLALGWQINPVLSNDEIVQILFDTCATANDGSRIINPSAFIDAIKNY